MFLFPEVFIFMLVFSVLKENSLLYNFLVTSRFSSDIYTCLNPGSSIRNSKLANVYGFACFTRFGLELFSVDYNYKRWTYIL